MLKNTNQQLVHCCLWSNLCKDQLQKVLEMGLFVLSTGRSDVYDADFANVAKWSQASEVSQYQPGSRTLEALRFLTLKYAFSHFSWYFFFNFYVHLSGYITKYLNMKDSDHLDKCNFPFLHLRKSRVFISSFGLVYRCIALRWGLGPALGPRSWWTFNCQYAFSHFSWYFFFKKIPFM